MKAFKNSSNNTVLLRAYALKPAMLMLYFLKIHLNINILTKDIKRKHRNLLILLPRVLTFWFSLDFPKAALPSDFTFKMAKCLRDFYL